MRKRFFPGILFLTIFYVVPVFCQIQNSDLEVGVIKFENIRIPHDKCYGDACEADEKAMMFLALFTNLPSGKGSIEIDSRGNNLIVTDMPSRIKVIEEMAKIFDKPNFSIDKLFTKQSEEKRHLFRFYKIPKFVVFDKLRFWK